MVDKAIALKVLDTIEDMRINDNPCFGNGKGLNDYDYRVMAAYIAESAGFYDRNEWTTLLKADMKTKYYKHYNERNYI